MQDTPSPPPLCGRQTLPWLWHGGGGGAISLEIALQPPSRVFFTRGTRKKKCGRSWRTEGSTALEVARRRCPGGKGSAVAVRVGQNRVLRPPRYPRYRPGPTGRHRRECGGQDVHRTKRYPFARAKQRGCKHSRLVGVRGHEVAGDKPHRDPRRPRDHGSKDTNSCLWAPER